MKELVTISKYTLALDCGKGRGWDPLVEVSLTFRDPEWQFVEGELERVVAASTSSFVVRAENLRFFAEQFAEWAAEAEDAVRAGVGPGSPNPKRKGAPDIRRSAAGAPPLASPL